MTKDDFWDNIPQLPPIENFDMRSINKDLENGISLPFYKVKYPKPKKKKPKKEENE